MEIIRAILRGVQSVLNFFLPFTDRNTPLLQDIAHTAALCAILYYAPRYLEQRRNAAEAEQQQEQQAEIDELPQEQQNEQQFDDAAIDSSDAEFEGELGAVDANGEPAGPADVPPQPPFAPDAPIPPAVHDFNDADFVEPGPAAAAGGARPGAQPARRAGAADRPVGAKKAKSLARRDQRRAYHEFQRMQGDAARRAAAEGAEEREAALAEERARRAAVERELEEKARREREAKKEREEEAMREEREKRKKVEGWVRQTLREENTRAALNLKELGKSVGRSREWVEGVVKAVGVLGLRKTPEGTKVLVMITGGGWLVRLDNSIMTEMYEKTAELDGSQIGFVQAGRILETILKA
ncbi:hypothetical protein BDY21DRAFT_330016 [Lineolata rhizophorae]|uniref:Uncharacterized protein n=1 Tax=Lineolata rhizophorae TaxID=578093 RepID=A0A6A6PDU1_9PEZI|nr:hypothetical protein BDY21DRAFT_330016 [Lineolata rhizophorae]